MDNLQRLMLQHLNPIKFILETIGVIWAVYFLWHQNLIGSLIAGLGLPIFSSILVWNYKTGDLKRSGWAKLVLVHAHPVNLVLHVIGAAVAIYGIWNHNTAIILTGLTVIILGHAWGWKSL